MEGPPAKVEEAVNATEATAATRNIDLMQNLQG
jgi:hypothetical protein